jgi:hypothetical protein
LFLEQGSQKLFNFPPSTMPAQPGMETLELVTGILEFLGGLLILVGILTRPASFILCGMMAEDGTPPAMSFYALKAKAQGCPLDRPRSGYATHTS